MNILLTGGAGYIGSHTAVVLNEAGHSFVLYDNLCNSDASVNDRLTTILGKRPTFIQGDVRDTALLTATLRGHSIDAVVHFAGLKVVGESTRKPVMYYDNNVGGTISVLRAMQTANVRQLVFSSSAAIYGIPQYLPVDENHPTAAIHPYGRNKLQIEELLNDLARAEPNWRIICLRYFNPVGAHASGLIGDNPSGIPSNLMPHISRVAGGTLPKLTIYGSDYSTADGTGVRDYLHVMDLAQAHLAALNHLGRQNQALSVFNLGTGRGYSVLEIIKAFESASGQQVPYEIVPRRVGDVAACYAQADRAATELQWTARRSLQEMCESTWKYQQQSGR